MSIEQAERYLRKKFLNPEPIKGHDITVKGLTATCSVCLQSWGGIEPIDIENLNDRFRCPGAPIRAKACPKDLNYHCMEPRCFDGCDEERADVVVGSSE